MAITYIGGSAGGNAVTTSDLNVADGDILICSISWEGAASVTSIIDDDSKNAMTVFGVSNQGGVYSAMGYRLVAEANATARFTVTLTAGSYKHIIVMQFRPTGGTSTIDCDDANAGVGNSVASQSANFDTTGDDEVMCGATALSVWGTIANQQIADVGADGVIVYDPAPNSALAQWYRIVNATQSGIHAQATHGSCNWICQAVAIKSVAGGATLVIADLAHVHTLESPTLTQKHLLAVANLAHIHSLQAPALTQKHLLAVSDLLHSHGLEGVVLTQKHLLAVSDLLHTHGLENVVLVPGVGGVTLVVADLLHGHSLDNVALTQKHLLAVNGLLHSHGLEGVTLAQKHLLAVDALLHGHNLEGVVLTQKHLLAINDLLHVHGLDTVVLTQKHIIAVQDLLHAHNLDNVVLVIPGAWVSLDGIRFYIY